MTTLPLSELLRRPTAVKKLTAAGQSVQITDHGKPLWIMQPALLTGGKARDSAAERAAWMDEELEAMLAERKSGTSAAQLIHEARG